MMYVGSVFLYQLNLTIPLTSLFFPPWDSGIFVDLFAGNELVMFVSHKLLYNTPKYCQKESLNNVLAHYTAVYKSLKIVHCNMVCYEKWFKHL